MPAPPSGPFSGVNPVKYVTGQTYLPQGMTPNGNTLATTINDLYYYPIFVWKTQAFAGAVTWNGGAGDNTELIRLGVYADDGAAGGPGTLQKDFGAVTLSAAAAKRTLSSAVTLVGPAWYWMAYAAQTSATMYTMCDASPQSAVGNLPPNLFATLTGFTLTAAPNATRFYNRSYGLFVSTAYGAFAATAVAPTSEISQAASLASNMGVEGPPIMGLIV